MKNKTNKKLTQALLAAFFIFSFSFTNAQQDPQYSMYMFDKMALNPAAAGAQDASQLNLISRAQWLDIQGAPITNALFFSTPTPSLHSGWGVEVMNDIIGPTISTSVQGNYAYSIPIGAGKLAFGLGFGVDDYAFDWSQINYKDKSDEYAMANNSTTFSPTAEFGLYYHSTTWYAGISINHLIASHLTKIITDSSATFARHAYLIAGKAFQSASGIIWNPSVIIQLAQNTPPAASVNLNVLLADKIWLGASIKFGYGFTFLAAYKASQSLSIGYAYDLGANAIGVVGGGTHELSISLNLGNSKITQVSPRYF